ncbi:ABC transporter permease [Bauldia litoralis]|uniref:Peptide/nickel transport system permease protein n=1 Tax=Bauldia litoralis TaxID=665467 RepID=A0A1G6CX78_9HYPH|nr:ABC transporter permease [Bauldia litoralis]SDB37537.1 peptide/nickel transport system permease protein [Bauldia litoralis]
MPFLSRLAGIVATLFLLSIVVFCLQLLLPGDIASILAGEDRSPETLAAISERFGLDQPIPVQYVRWLGNALQGDLGMSMRFNQPVSTLVLSKLPVTFQLATMALIFAILIGVTSGIIAAVFAGTAIDQTLGVFSILGFSIPNFWLGILLIMVVSVQWGLLPASGYVSPFVDPWQSFRTMLMPAFVLGSQLAAVLMRHTRSAMIEVLHSDYVRTAHAKGMPRWRIIIKHALRNALVPVVTLGALEFGQLLGGSVLTEWIFTIPGIGKLLVDAVFNRDYPIVQAVVLCSGAIYITLNLLADIAYVFLDPRTRRGAT